MTVITAHLTVADDGTISTATPLSPGQYVATIESRSRPDRQEPDKPFDVDALPIHDFGPWPERLSLRREDLYDDMGR